MGLREDIAAATTPEARRAVRAAAMAAVAPMDIARGTSTIRIVATRQVADTVVLSVRVLDSLGHDATPPDLNPVRIVNPPVLVPDPAGAVAITTMQRLTLRQAPVPVTHRYREDPAEALRIILRDLIR